MTLTQDQKDEWVKKLRSGEYEQGMGFLFRHGKFCCLGVLADSEGILGNEDVEGHRTVDQNLAFLPAKYGLLSWDNQRDLSKMNDNGKSFDELADYIEENVNVCSNG